MIAPPLTAERLLEALSEQSDFRDAVLGDLAEEFARRAEADGVPAARSWYYRESIRTVPHLLGHWARGLGKGDIKHIANVVFASYIFGAALVFALTGVVGAVMMALGVQFAVAEEHTVIPPVGLAIVSMSSVTGGFVVAWLDKRTPLISAIVLGLVVVIAALLMNALLPRTPMAAWYQITASTITMLGTSLGAVLYVRRRIASTK
ncbi:MAG: hypothetical protein V4550_00965 [Gemmatimonadota bacterium]